jgi:hypothetical protein
MNDFQNQLIGKLPTPIRDVGRKTWYSVYRASQWPAATFHPWRRRSIQNLNRFHNAHLGERCFIIGNGPSLKQTDLSKLKGEYSFGMNRIYLLFPELGFSTTYYLSVNDLVIEQCALDILALNMPRFLSWRSRSFVRDALGDKSPFPAGPPVSFLHTTYTGPRFAHNVSHRLWEGATVTYVAMQLAFHMGFSQVILIGVDHSFSTMGKPNTTVVSQGDDPDHFDSKYFGKGFRWQLPDLETSECAYRMAQDNYLSADREILDATVGGKLDVFPKLDYDSLFNESS